jgi:hypothetical protein
MLDMDGHALFLGSYLLSVEVLFTEDIIALKALPPLLFRSSVGIIASELRVRVFETRLDVSKGVLALYDMECGVELPVVYTVWSHQVRARTVGRTR